MNAWFEGEKQNLFMNNLELKRFFFKKEHKLKTKDLEGFLYLRN